MKKTDAAPVELEQPLTGGSFIRQEDGTLKMIEGAIADDEPAFEAEPVADLAPIAQASGESGAPFTQQSEG